MSATPEFEYSHREDENVVIQDLTDWSGEVDGMETVESEWKEFATQSHITAAVTEFGSGMDLGAETQDHLAEEWTQNAKLANLDKIAFVSDGLEGRAVSANLDVSHEIRSFGSLSEALEWAKE